MTPLNSFKDAKKGDVYLFKYIDEDSQDERKTIIIIGDKDSQIFYFSDVGMMKKDVWWTNDELDDLMGFYGSTFALYKLNKKEIKEYKKLILISSL